MAWKIDGCDNTMFFENDGFCTRCGRNHKKLQKTRGQSKFEHRQVIERERIEHERTMSYDETIEQTPHYKVARDTIKMLAEVYDFDVKIEFTNSRTSTCTPTDGKWVGDTFVLNSPKFTVKFGYQNLDAFAERGYTEYKSLYYMVDGKPVGAEAGKWVAMHEFAHAVSNARNGRPYGVSHGASFINAYREVKELVL